MGFVSPNDNSQSSFEEHEEKTLYFEFSCTHIRLVLHENHRNDMNIFNQVALNELTVQGEILSAQEVQGVDLTEASSEEEEQDAGHRQRSQQLGSSSQRSSEAALQELAAAYLGPRAPVWSARPPPSRAGPDRASRSSTAW